MTPKQVRNGVPGPGMAGGNVAQPGPSAAADISVAQQQAQDAADGRKHAAGFGPPVLDPGVRDWDQGLAINDVEGGGSG